MTDVTEPWIKFSTNNGSSFLSSGNESGRVYIGMSGSSSSGHERDAASERVQLGSDLGNDASRGFVFRVDLINITTSNHKNIIYHACGFHGTDRYNWIGGGHLPHDNVINYVRFQTVSYTHLTLPTKA